MAKVGERLTLTNSASDKTTNGSMPSHTQVTGPYSTDLNEAKKVLT